MNKILLHACCAPCASYPIKRLGMEGLSPIVFFYNPNIYPQSEYDTRRKELQHYCALLGVEYIEGEYDIQEFYKNIKGYELEPERGKRCSICFYMRFLKTAQVAKSLGIDSFTTTLSVSPHKSTLQIFETAKLVEKETGIKFLGYNFKKQDGFKISRTIAKQNNMYAQNYCGCEFSMKKQMFAGNKI